MQELVYPPPLAPGDRVCVVAPSSPFPRDQAAEFWRGLAWVRQRYEVTARAAVLGRSGFLAGDDATRARELGHAMTAPGVKAILVARGGYGSMRVLDALPWGDLSRAPRWVVGFSDVTALHAEATARGVASIHAPNVTGLARVDPWTRACWIRALERPREPGAWCDLHVVREGKAEGPLVGGNLALVEALAASGRWRPPEGAILALEDVTERPYRLDRMLTALRLGGHLGRLGGVVLGEFAQCEAGPDGVLASAVLADRTGDLGIPVVSGAPFGHGARNDAFVVGARARIDGDRVTIG